MRASTTTWACTQPLDQQGWGSLLQPPSPLLPGSAPGAGQAEGLRTCPSTVAAAEGQRGASTCDAVTGGHAGVKVGFEHRPVMLEEVVELFASVPEGLVLDATIGAGGHASALLAASRDRRVVGLDRDPEAVAAASSLLAPFGSRATVVKGRFDHLGEILAELGAGELAGALFDLGVSSPQIDRADRGFSYRLDGPLDMRMGAGEGPTAADLVNTASEDQLARLFALHGEGRFARRIAAAIVAARPVLTTSELAALVSSAVPAALRRRGHPAKRVFQALRAEVNSELEVLPVAIEAAIGQLMPRGRLVVISYHSGEDTVVKQALLTASTGGCTCPPGLPCGCGAVPTVRLLNRGARKPSPDELRANPRARSARLRAAEALPIEQRRPR